MKKVIVLIFLSCASHMLFAQKVNLSIEPKELEPIQEYLNDFQGLDYLKFVLDGKDLKGKSPSIFMKEFRKDTLIKVDTLLNGFQDKSYLTLDSTDYEFYFLTQIDNENFKFKTFIRSAKFGAGKKTLSLLPDDYGYVMRDFLGNKNQLEYPISTLIPLFVIIPPVELGNGFGSYCDVVNSGVAAEELGRQFNLKQYFLIEIGFH